MNETWAGYDDWKTTPPDEDEVVEEEQEPTEDELEELRTQVREKGE